ncbi:hypothetical protein HAX54_000679 [Datura stramonium]|uniref:Uncharacterized protein n=1 Tax=Datura stramonium TaxID=4076 RepID=A0ABS8T3J3_DATST|nr:hypothetical protein [Datura stramonium]
MANTATGQPFTAMVGQSPLAAPSKIPISNDSTSYNVFDYSKILKLDLMNKVNPRPNLPSITMKPITMLHGELYLKWSESEVVAMNVIENLQHVLDGKFSYGWPEREQIECRLQGHDVYECGIVHPELARRNEDHNRENIIQKEIERTKKDAKKITEGIPNRFPPKMLSSGKVVKNLGEQREINKKGKGRGNSKNAPPKIKTKKGELIAENQYTASESQEFEVEERNKGKIIEK